jgi:ribonuclease HI
MTDAPAIYEAWSDGSCLGNPGPGGFAAVVLHPDTRADIAVVVGGELSTTNQRMEMTAAARAIAATPLGARVVVHTDSKYVVDGMTKWTRGWARSGWKKQDGAPVANVELWQELVSACSIRKVSWIHVRGHVGIDLNERVDRLANTEARRMKASSVDPSPKPRAALAPTRSPRRWINTKL